MRVEYRAPTVDFWDDNFSVEQTGGFVGIPYQRGAGLGSIFRGIFRMVTPILKRAAKAAGKQALSVGANVISDVVKGGDITESISKHGKEAIGVLADKTAQRVRQANTLEELGVEDQQGGALGSRTVPHRTEIMINGSARKKKRHTHKALDIFSK